MMGRPFSLLVFLVFLAAGPASWGAGMQSSRETVPDRAETFPEKPLTFEEAVGRYYEGRFEESIEGFRSIVSRDPEHRAAREQFVRLLREEGRFLEAKEQIRVLLETAGEDRVRWERELLVVSLLDGTVPVELPSLLPSFADQAGDQTEDQPEDRTGERASGPAESPADAETLFWTGLGFFERGDAGAASRLLNASLAAEPYNPAALYFLGLIELQEGRYTEAEDRLNAALRQEPNLTMAFLPLARAKIGNGSHSSAYSLLLRARASLPANREIADRLAALIAEYPELTEVREEAARRRRIRTVTPVMQTFPERPEDVPIIRVGLAEEVDQIHVKTGGPFVLETGSGGIVHRSERTAILIVERTEDGIRVAEDGADDAEGTTPVASGLQGPVTLRYEDPRFTTALFDMEYGSGYYFAGTEDRFYRGSLEFSPHGDGITVVNAVGLEEYLYATVPSEIPSSWPEEALRAQAIAARSYTLANMGRFASRGFDLMGSVRSASYRGAGNEAERTTRAVDATRGMILVVDGKPLNAVYSANTGGYTESAESVWGFPSALKAVADPKVPSRQSPLPPEELHRWLLERPESYSAVRGYHARAAYRWRLWIPAEEIAVRAGRGEIGTVVSLTTRGRGISGRVERVLVRGTDGSVEVKGDSIRSRLGGLRSNLFSVEPKLGPDGYPEYFLFSGAGWGHGVGMDQSGAAGMASEGWTAERILGHYYSGVRVADDYGRTQAAPPPDGGVP